MKYTILYVIFFTPIIVVSQNINRGHINYRISKYEKLIDSAASKEDNQQYNAALLDCNEAIQLNVKGDFAYYLRATAEGFVQDYDRALTDIDRAILLNSKMPIYYAERASIYWHSAKPENNFKALEDFNTAIQKATNGYWSDDLHVIYFNRATFKQDQLDFKGSLKDCNLLISKFSTKMKLQTLCNSYTLRALVKLKLNDFKGAVDDCDNAIELKPGNDYEPYLTRGKAKFILRDLTAIDDLKKAQELYYSEFKSKNSDIESAIADYYK